MYQIDEGYDDNISTDVLRSTADNNSAVVIESFSGYKRFDAKIDNIVTDSDILEYKPYSHIEIVYLSFYVAANMENIAVYSDEVSFDTSSISYLRMFINITISLSQGFQAIFVDIVELSHNQ